MKILNKEKTHFMQADEKGAYKVKFGTVSEVDKAINTILNNSKPSIVVNTLHENTNGLFEQPNVEELR